MGAVARAAGAVPGRQGHRLGQFKDMATQVVVSPGRYASGKVIYPYERAK